MSVSTDERAISIKNQHTYNIIQELSLSMAGDIFPALVKETVFVQVVSDKIKRFHYSIFVVILTFALVKAKQRLNKNQSSLTLSATQQQQEREEQDLHVGRWYVDKRPAPALLYWHTSHN